MELDSTLPSARSALSAWGYAIERVEFLARGATSVTWRIDTADGSHVFRKIDEDRVLDGRIDSFIRKLVGENGGCVAAPVRNSDQTELRIDGNRWCLDRFVPGCHPERGKIPPEAARQLGRTLAALHGIPVEGSGRPGKLADGAIIGRETDPVEGVLSRFENPLPQAWRQGFRHPIYAAVPTLEHQIESRLQEVSRQVALGNGVLCHADLHERQLICSAGRLAALIDFGEAAILDRHWDLGSALYFHGWQIFSAIFDAYRTCSNADQPSADLAVSFSIAIAMHHASRSRLQGKEHRLGYAAQHIQAAVGTSV